MQILKANYDLVATASTTGGAAHRQRSVAAVGGVGRRAHLSDRQPHHPPMGAMIEKYLSQTQFAERIGVAPSSMGRYKLPPSTG